MPFSMRIAVCDANTKRAQACDANTAKFTSCASRWDALIRRLVTSLLGQLQMPARPELAGDPKLLYYNNNYYLIHT
jgi:hypothetical protein